MFINNTSNENKISVNTIQEPPNRLSIHTVNKCEDQVIGFEFIKRQYENNPRCFGSAIVNLCVPIEVLNPIVLDNAEFWATNDPCYKDWIIKYKENPHIEIQRDTANKVTGILVRFFKQESCCYPLNMAFRLYGFDSTGCKYLLSSGLLIFR